VTASYPIQSTFNRGEISPLLGSRADVDFWRQSLAECRNFHVLTHGGIRRRSGSRFIAEVKDSSEAARLLPFRFSETQSYVLSLNDGFVRFFALRGVVGAPYEIAHPWAAADIARLSFSQFNDVAYFAHPSYAQRTLTRSADTNWAFAEQVFKDGPYLPPDPQGTTLTPASYGAAHNRMTGLTTPSDTVASSTGAAGAWEVFDGTEATYVRIAGKSGWVSYTYDSGTRVVDAYWLQSSSDGSSVPEATPSAWVLEGYNGSTWITLDSRTGETGWGAGETRFYEFANQTGYSAYRFRWTANAGGPGVDTDIGELALHERAENQAAFNLTASSTAGINDGDGFQTTDVGRHIRLLGSDGKWRWARIVARTSTTVVTIRLYGHALPSLAPIVNWQLGAWSVETGFPGSVELFNERLSYARTARQPVTVWCSKQGVFDDFGVSAPVVETDGVGITLLSSNMNEIIGLAADEDLLTFSAGQIRSVGPADITKAFSATNITQRKGPTTGAKYVKPLLIGSVVLYIAAGGTKIRELILGDQNRYVAPELSIVGEQFFKTMVVDWAFAEKPDPTIYCVTGDGLLVAVTYDREQRVLGFARHDLGGVVESIAVIPGPAVGSDDVYVLVRRTINGGTKRYIEVLEKPFDSETDVIEDAFFVDSGLTYSGSPISTVTGLGHLEGEDVVALADGSVVTGLTVSGGSITLPDAASKIHVGLPFTSRAVTLPVFGPGQDGTLFGRRNAIIAGAVDVLGTGALQVGALGSEEWTPPLYEQILKDGGGLFGNPIDLRTGFQRCDIEGSWADGNGQVVMQSDVPLPALVRSFVFQLENEP
jgi:hypothetical protein